MKIPRKNKKKKIKKKKKKKKSRPGFSGLEKNMVGGGPFLC